MNKPREKVFKYLLEFLIVAFGVFLGVYVGEWKSQKKVDINTERSLDFIVEEFTTNISKLETTIGDQTALVEDVDSLMQFLEEEDYEKIFYQNDKFRFNKLPNYRGLGFANLEDIMYESAKINGVIQELNISTTQLIARSYKRQEGYLSFSKQVVSKLINIDSQSKIADVVSIFELVKYDGLSSEKWLLQELKATKENLEEVIKNKSYK